MTATINGKIHQFDGELSVTELLQQLELSTDGTAVALNNAVVLRKDHAHTTIQDGDTVEIIRAVAGG